jgi:hypothetical protein
MLKPFIGPFVRTGVVLAACFCALTLKAADPTETKSALETDPQGWKDILPPADLKKSGYCSGGPCTSEPPS